MSYIALQTFEVTLNAVLDDIADNASEGSISNEALISLSGLFPHVVFDALQILDDKPLVRFVTDHNRELFQVPGLMGNVYTVLVKQRFCDCPDYSSQVLPGKSFLCKHILAAMLSKCLHKYVEVARTESEFQNILLGPDQ
eukprot:CFRG0813T1